MRPVIVLLFWLGAGVLAADTTAWAQPFRIVTWQVDRLPPVKAGATNSPADEQRLNEIATTLNSTDADAIILYGVQESEAAKKIATLIKAKKYSVTHHAAFRHGGLRGTIAGQPVAILSRREKLAGKSVEWTHTGRIEMPGGFGLAVFRHGQTAVCVYVACLPGSLTNGVTGPDGKYFARKRNYAAQFLAHHSSWLATTFTNPVIATYLTGDFQLTSKGPVNDECAKLLEAAGFRALAPGTATDKSTTSVTNSFELDRVQDPIFTKGIEFIASRQINRPASEHPIVVCDLTFKDPATTAKATVKPQKPGMKTESEKAGKWAGETERPPVPTAHFPTHSRSVPSIPSSSNGATAASPAPVSRLPSGTDRRWIWWTGVGALSLAILGLTGWISAARRQAPIPSAPVQVAAPLHLDLQSEVRGERAEGGQLPPSPSPVTPPTSHLASPLTPAPSPLPLTATGQTDRVPWDNPAVGSGSERLHAKLAPQLKQLMRDVVVAWLARQRAHLLESHERGTEQVIELHARVEKIKEQFQERLRSQQHRIAELDAALRSKEKVILELVRARRPETGGS